MELVRQSWLHVVFVYHVLALSLVLLNATQLCLDRLGALLESISSVIGNCK